MAPVSIRHVLDQGCRTNGYEQSVQNLAQTSLERDNVFSDDYDLQMPTASGDVSTGFS